MTTTRRPRRRHAALGARWMTAGLAASGTLGITSYLELQQHASATAAASSLVDDATVMSPEFVAPSTVPVPPAPKVKIVTVPGKKKKSASTGAPSAPGAPAATPRTAPAPQAPPATQAPRTAPKQTSTNATTKSSPR